MFAILCVLFCARVVGLDRQSLWFGEGYTLALAKASSLTGFLHSFGSFTTSEHLQPLYYAIVFLWSRLAGTSDFALRFPSVLCSIGSGLIVFAYASRLVKRFGLAARWLPHAVLFAYCVSSFAFYYAQEARPYALLQFVAFLVVYLWHRQHASTTSTWAQAPFVTAAALATMTSPFGALLVGSLAFADWLCRVPGWVTRWQIPLVVSAAVFGFYVFAGCLLLPPFLGHDVVLIRQSLWMNLAYGFYGLFFGTTLGPSSSLLHRADKMSILYDYWPILLISVASLAVFAISGAGVLRRVRSTPPEIKVLACAAAFYTVALFIIFGAIGHLNVLPRHASAMFTLLFLSGMYCASQASSILPGERYCLVLGIAGVLALNILSVWRYWADPAYQKDDYRTVAAMVRQGAGSPETPVFLVAGDPGLFQHYGVSLIDASSVDPKDLSQFLLNHSSGEQTVRLVFNEFRDYRWSKSATPAWMLQPAYQCSEQRHLAYMQILTCKHTANRTEQATMAASHTGQGYSYAR